MTNFTKGDRVELNQDYDGQKKGDTGVVIDAEDPGTALRGLEVRMDKNNAIVWAFVERWDKLPAKKFKVGDRVQRKGLSFQYGKHKGKDLVVTKLREEESDFDYTVSVVGSVRSADAGDYIENELEAFVPPKTSGAYAENSGFKIGDRVKVNEDNAFMARLGGKLGTVTEGGGSSLIRVIVDGENSYTAFYKSEISQYTEPKFNVGDYVEVVRSAYNLGRKGWVVEPTPYWAARNDDCVHITTQKGGKSEFRFGAESLKAIEEPWAPKFKKGDWVEVPASHNSEWAGIGQVTEEASKDLDIAVVKMVTGKSYGVGRTGGFREGDLLPAEEPKPFNIGDYVEVVANPKNALGYHAGTKGWVVESPYKDDRIHISITGKGGKATWRFDPKDLQAAEEPKPFAIGERVQVDGYGNQKSYDHIIGVVTGYDDAQFQDDKLWVFIDASETKEGKRRFPAENLKKLPKLPKRELPTEAAKLIHITKYSGKTVDLVAMHDGTDDYDPWFAPTEGDSDNWLSTRKIEEWSPVKVTVSL